MAEYIVFSTLLAIALAAGAYGLYIDVTCSHDDISIIKQCNRCGAIHKL